MSQEIDLKDYIRDIPDFPKPGINFKDITPLLLAPAAFQESLKQFADHFRDHDIDHIMAAEARGFIFGTPLAAEMSVGFIPVRKPGKLPHETIAIEYELEYGTDTVEIHKDAIKPGERILIVDDLLATGGTVGACVKLAEQAGAEIVSLAFLIELDFLNGRDKLGDHEIFSLIHY